MPLTAETEAHRGQWRRGDQDGLAVRKGAKAQLVPVEAGVIVGRTALGLPLGSVADDFFVAAADEVPPPQILFTEWFTTDEQQAHGIGPCVQGERGPTNRQIGEVILGEHVRNFLQDVRDGS
ncbi:hypothetical protein CLE01_24430 [Cryobacterium levicorallinum]|nr:hypothetical protein CLE01_24430 [Cryobacterium levicorallinum]